MASQLHVKHAPTGPKIALHFLCLLVFAFPLITCAIITSCALLFSRLRMAAFSTGVTTYYE